MKKNKMMRLASWLLVLTLLTTCIISGTFAKYVTSDDAEDTARVAKWGVTTTISGALFGEHYNAFSEAESSNQISADYTGSVDATDALTKDTGKHIVAPGTKSDAMKISISGRPEVSGKIDVEVNVDTDAEGNTIDSANYSDIWLADGEYGVMVNVTDTVKTNDDVVDLYIKSDNDESYIICTTNDTYDSDKQYYKLMDTVNMKDYDTESDDPRYDGDKYYPVIWSLTNVKTGTTGDSSDSVGIHTVSDLKDGINGIIDNAKEFQSFTNLNEQVGDISINWEWPFESESEEESGVDEGNEGDPFALEATGSVASTVVDGCDTILGNLMKWDLNSDYQVVKIGSEERDVEVDNGDGTTTTTTITVPTYTGVTKEVVNDVTYAQIGEGEQVEKVACLTVGFNIKVTVSQTD